MLKITQEKIGLNEALTLLAGSPGNRPIRKGHVAYLADQMLKGRWRPRSVVILDQDGLILDGHHRMLAIGAARTPQWFVVMRGAPAADRDVIDVNIARTLGDKLAFVGVKQACARAGLISSANPLTRNRFVAGPIAFAWRRDSAAVREFTGLLVDHVAAKGSPAWLLHRALVRARMPGRDVAITRLSLWTLWALEQHIGHRSPNRLSDAVEWEKFRSVYPQTDRDDLGEYYSRVQGMHAAKRRARASEGA